MNANHNVLDEIFGEGFTAEAEATRAAEEERIAECSTRIHTEDGVLKSWMMTRCKNGTLVAEMSELSGTGWHRIDPPDRITVASDADHRHIYRRALIDRTPDGDIGAWIYVPNCPEQAPAPEIHIFND